MAFFPRNLYHSHHPNTNTTDGSFTPLFRLLDDFDNYSRQGAPSTRRPGLQTWQPKFDIRETADNYELHGELAGLSKDDVHIEFSDPQTMQVRGKVERTYTAGTPPAGLLGGTSAITEGGEEKHDSAHKVTVEDESEAKETESPTGEPAPEKPAAAADNAKYWLTERSIGEFARTFSFPTRVEQDGVTASLKDGILNVTVPKAKKYESRRIAVN
ncbi:unnamed protein product [Clonostachys solani]|uniref:SHSP domain-containing protein n=1 Tax=Clonostachys solani TaxID=160281 RepID=A0A9N9ZQG8_9HYPO|nr:unnamed protein product [Clonostachys solani]